MVRETAAPEVLFHAVSDRNRLRLFRLLRQQELNVQELVSILGLKQPTVSKHLAVLREVGLLRQRREGTWMWYEAVTAGDFEAGSALLEEIARAAGSVPEADVDDDGLAGVIAERGRQARDFFAGIAERWDTIRESYEHADIRLGTVAALVDRRVEVVDLGCGTGAMLPLLATATNRVVAVDTSEAMLHRARERCRREGVDGVEFRLADIEDLPFPDGSFHAACSSMVLHHLDRPAKAIEEMARVVRPGGTVVVIAFTRHELEWMRDELAHRRLGFERKEMERLLRGAGLACERWLVRSGLPADASGEVLPAGRRRDDFVWPDVFLAVARREV